MKYAIPIGERSILLDTGLAPLGEHRDFDEIVRTRKGITDITGVPLDSDRNQPPPDLDFEYKACPYSESPSRYPHGQPSEVPMSGLESRRLSQSFPEIRRLLLASRIAYLRLIGAGEDHELTVEDGLSILGALQYLPSYLTERYKDPVAPKDELPQHLIVGANCASGATGAVGACAQGDTRLPMPAGEILLQAAETEPDGGLVGRKTVCAASPRMIAQFLNLLRDGSESIDHGTVADETSKMLNPEELGAAVLVGVSLESVLGYNQIAMVADATCAPILEKYNPKKHNPRRATAAYKEFSERVAVFVHGYEQTTAITNLALHREPMRDDEFTDVLTNNRYGFASIRLAKAKGLK